MKEKRFDFLVKQKNYNNFLKFVENKLLLNNIQELKNFIDIYQDDYDEIVFTYNYVSEHKWSICFNLKCEYCSAKCNIIDFNMFCLRKNKIERILNCE